MTEAERADWEKRPDAKLAKQRQFLTARYHAHAVYWRDRGDYYAQALNFTGANFCWKESRAWQDLHRDSSREMRRLMGAL